MTARRTTRSRNDRVFRRVAHRNKKFPDQIINISPKPTIPKQLATAATHIPALAARIALSMDIWRFSRGFSIAAGRAGRNVISEFTLLGRLQ
jgi:hypothetical protein